MLARLSLWQYLIIICTSVLLEQRPPRIQDEAFHSSYVKANFSTIPDPFSTSVSSLAKIAAEPAIQ